MKDAPNVAAQQQSIRTAMLYGFPIVTFFVMTWQPAIIQLTFAFTSLILGLQNLVLRNSWVRKKLGIAPLTGASATETLAAFRRPTATTGDAKKSTTSSPDEIRQKKAKQYELIRKRQRQSINDNDTRY
jgi:membrane protein insertase Oxa1/YidC/SpoIIIJ